MVQYRNPYFDIPFERRSREKVNLMKIKTVSKPARKARKGINPFTKEEMVFKAKPARKAVKVLALKGLKDMV